MEWLGFKIFYIHAFYLVTSSRRSLCAVEVEDNVNPCAVSLLKKPVSDTKWEVYPWRALGFF